MPQKLFAQIVFSFYLLFFETALSFLVLAKGQRGAIHFFAGMVSIEGRSVNIRHEYCSDTVVNRKTQRKVSGKRVKSCKTVSAKPKSSQVGGIASIIGFFLQCCDRSDASLHDATRISQFIRIRRQGGCKPGNSHRKSSIHHTNTGTPRSNFYRRYLEN